MPTIWIIEYEYDGNKTFSAARSTREKAEAYAKRCADEHIDQLEADLKRCAKILFVTEVDKSRYELHIGDDPTFALHDRWLITEADFE